MYVNQLLLNIAISQLLPHNADKKRSEITTLAKVSTRKRHRHRHHHQHHHNYHHHHHHHHRHHHSIMTNLSNLGSFSIILAMFNLGKLSQEYLFSIYKFIYALNTIQK